MERRLCHKATRDLIQRSYYFHMLLFHCEGPEFLWQKQNFQHIIYSLFKSHLSIRTTVQYMEDNVLQQNFLEFFINLLCPMFIEI